MELFHLGVLNMPEDKADDAKKNESIQKLINGGAEIAGGAVGGALGFLAGGPIGAMVLGAGGAAAAMALKHIGQEVSERLLGPREKVRVGGILAIAASEINQRIQNGESVRSDGFFDEKPSGRSDAEEVAESVLLKSQREPEEKKIPYMGHLLSSVAFDRDCSVFGEISFQQQYVATSMILNYYMWHPKAAFTNFGTITFDAQISAQMAHQITKAAEQLTYRQLCILKLAVVKQAFGLRDGDYRGHGPFSKELYQVLYECLDLYHRGFVNFGGGVALGLTDVAPGKMTVQGLGADLFNLMKLAAIPDEDLVPIAMQLK
jgi:hypothetical protein